MQAPNDASLAFRELWPLWEEQYACKVITATRDTFQDMFDDDDTLEYEPLQTAAIILTGGDEEAEKAALEVRPRRVRRIRADADQIGGVGYVACRSAGARGRPVPPPEDA